MHETSQNTLKYRIGFTLTSIISLWLGWQLHPFFLFVGFVPILMLDTNIGNQKRGNFTFWLYCLGIMLGWNLATTWWLAKASLIGAIAAIVLNAALMAIPLLAFRVTRRFLGTNYGFLTFILYWLSFEYLHLHWQLSWSWLTLGNAFASVPYLVQWYEYTGVLGGSLWVLVTNILVYLLVNSRLKHNRVTYGIYTTLFIALPCICSPIISFDIIFKSLPINTVIVQPNINPYTQKFVGSAGFIPYSLQMQRFLAQAKPHLDKNTRLILLPETAFDGQYNEAKLQQYPVFRQTQALLKQYPKLSILTGATTAKFYGRSKPTPSARLHPKAGKYYDVFNAAILLTNQQAPQFYHKSKLVPGVETLPYPQVLGVLGNWLLDLGGTSGSYGTQNTRDIFTVPRESYRAKIAPLICFESLHGDFTRQYILNGAKALMVITNDGWWGDTDGHRRHFEYARLRAIENRRSVAFCANNGTSGVIDRWGKIKARTKYGEQAVLSQSIHLNSQITFYAQNGDYLGRLSAFMTVGLLLTMLVKRVTRGRTGSLT